MNKTKITTIGGGSGQYALLSGLRDLENIDIKAVVSMVDSGGSTGRLRDELGILPPGDILKCVLALSPNRDSARAILQKRFSNGNARLSGHSAGNLFLTILSQHAGSFPEGVKALGEVLDIRGEVLPVTIDKATLAAELDDGSHLYGEAAIDVPRFGREKIRKTFLVPHHTESIKVYPPVIDAILETDYIVLGPGDLYTSIIPNFLVGGVKEAMQETKAKIIFVSNIMTKYGETDNFKTRNFIEEIERHIGKRIDVAIINTKIPSEDILASYKKQNAAPVENNMQVGERGMMLGNFTLLSGGIVRHDSEKIAKAIYSIIKRDV